MDELEIKGKKYISSKRAAEITGYAKDYVGQLARAGKISATRFGRAWYVEESALLAHSKADNKETPQVLSTTPVKASAPVLSPHFYKPYSFPKTWGEVRYFEDHSELMPVILKPAVSVAEPVEANSVKITLTKPAPVVVESKKTEEATKRIKILEDGIIRRDPVLRTAEASLKTETPKQVLKTKKKGAISSPYRLLPVTLIAGSFIFFVLAVSGFFLSSGVEYVPTRDAYTASVLPSFEHIVSIVESSPFVEAGTSALGGFVKTIGDSFWSFFDIGLDFFKTI